MADNLKERIEEMKTALAGVPRLQWYDIPHPEWAGGLHRIALRPNMEWVAFGYPATAIATVAAYMVAWCPANAAVLIAEVERLERKVEQLQKNSPRCSRGNVIGD